jgi:CBS domain containing-hemolysin-like protein
MVSRIFEGPSSLGTGHPLPAWFFQTLVNVILTAPIVLFLCDISPKIIGAKANQLVAPLLVGPLTFVYVGLKPLRLSLRRVAWAFSRAPKTEADGEKAGGENKLLKESDFIHLVEEGHKEGSIQEKELELIKNVFRLEEMELQELLTPLSGMRCMTEDTSLRNALSALRGATYARIPIMNASRNRVLGILHSKDLLRAQLEPQLLSNRVSTLMRKPLFVKSTLHLNSLFRKFKQQRTHMAVVRNEAGVSIGVITMSDILETLFENHLLDDSEYGGSSLHHPSYLTKSKTRAD